MVSHTSLSGGSVGSGGTDWTLRSWRAWFNSGSSCCSGSSLYFCGTRRSGHTQHWQHWGPGVKPALCLFTAEQPAGCISLVRSCRRTAGPSWREHMAHSCYQMSTASKIISGNSYLPRCGTWFSSKRPVFIDSIFKLSERHKLSQEFYTT